MDIFKYPLTLTAHPQRFPIGRKRVKPLTVQLQNGVPTLWVMLEPHGFTEEETLVVQIFPTGSDFDNRGCDTYVGTWQYQNGTAWHVFAWGEETRESQG